MRAYLCAILATMMLAVAPSPSPAPLTGQRAFVDVTVNSVDQGVHTVLVLSNNGIAVARTDLDDLGLTKIVEVLGSPAGPYVPLDALKTGLTYHFDSTRLALAITVQPQYLSASSVSLTRSLHPSISRISSAFLNYGLLMTQGEPGDLSTQLGSTLGNGVFTATFNALNQQYRMTSFLWREDDPVTMRSLIVGDAYTDLGDLSGSPVMRGVTYERNFSLNPYFDRFASHSLQGYVATPSTAYVYVNGELIDQIQLQPGSFSINNLPQLAGISNAQVVIRDAFGNTQVLSQTYYEGVQVLPSGVDNFTYSVGDPQDGQGHSLGPNAGVAEYSVGVTNSFTLGGRAEYSKDVTNGGPEFAMATRFGEFDFVGLGSSSEGYGGSAGELVYNYLSRNWDLNVLYQTQSDNYANLIIQPTQDRLLENFVTTLGVQLWKGQFVNLQWMVDSDRDLGHQSGYGAQTTVGVTHNLSLVFDFEHQQGDSGIQNDFYTSLLFPIGLNTFVSVTQDGATEGGNTSYEVDRPSRSDQPLGYTFDDTVGGGQDETFAQVNYEAPFGEYYAQRTTFAGMSNEQVDAAGSIDFADGSVLFSRPIQNGYAVVDTGIPGVPVYVNGVWAGTTNGAGKLANPDVIPYAANDIAIDTSKLPLDINFNTTSQTFSSPLLAAGLAVFRPVRTQSFLGTLVVVAAGKTVNPQYGTLTLSVAEGGVETSEIGDSGEFYFSNLTAGTYPAHVVYAGGTCDFTVTIPQTTSFYVRLGQLTCTTITPALPAPSSR